MNGAARQRQRLVPRLQQELLAAKHLACVDEGARDAQSQHQLEEQQRGVARPRHVGEAGGGRGRDLGGGGCGHDHGGVVQQGEHLVAGALQDGPHTLQLRAGSLTLAAHSLWLTASIGMLMDAICTGQ